MTGLAIRSLIRASRSSRGPAVTFETPSDPQSTGAGNAYEASCRRVGEVQILGSDGRNVAADPVGITFEFEYPVCEIQVLGAAAGGPSSPALRISCAAAALGRRPPVPRPRSRSAVVVFLGLARPVRYHRPTIAKPGARERRILCGGHCGRAWENLSCRGFTALGVARRPAGCQAASRSSRGARHRLSGAVVPHS